MLLSHTLPCPGRWVKRGLSVAVGALLLGMGAVMAVSAFAEDKKIVSEEEFLSLFETQPAGQVEVGLAMGKASPPKPRKVSVTPYVLFGTGSDRITGADSIQQLVLAGRAFQKAVERGMTSRLVIEVEGHTDNVGSHNANQKLSEARAESVCQYLLENFGLPQELLIAKGYGTTQPIVSNDTKEGRAKNRRVVFKVAPKTAVEMK